MDKTNLPDDIVARRIFIFKAALAEVGEDADVYHNPRPGAPFAISWTSTADRWLAFRASTIAHPHIDEDVICWTCWDAAEGKVSRVAATDCWKVPLKARLLHLDCGVNAYRSRNTSSLSR